MGGVLDRMAAGLTVERRVPHHPGHHIQLSVLRHGIMDGDADILALAGVQAVH